jgi:tetratricopeptide (TPR) repeat protein
MPSPVVKVAAAAAVAVFGAVAAPAAVAPLGDARAAVTGDNPALGLGVAALTTNPAALAESRSWSFPFTHRIYPAPGATAETAGVGIPLGAYGTFAAAAATSRFGDVERYDDQGRYLGSYTYHDDRVAGGYGVHVASWLAGGASFHYDRHVFSPDDETTGYGLDAGVYVRPLAGSSTREYAVGVLTFGAVFPAVLASNVETRVGEYRESPTAKLGASWTREIGALALTFAGATPAGGPGGVAVACEAVVATYFVGRVGLEGREPAAGFGVQTDLFSFDYAYIMRELGANHSFSVSVNPGRDVGAPGERRRRIDKLISEGRAYFDAGKYDLAASRFAAALEWDPGNAVARQYGVLAKYREYCAAGEAATAASDWEAARRAFNAALVVVPGDFVAAEYLAHVDQLEREEQEKRAEDERVLGKLAEARDLIKRGGYRSALEICQELAKAHPERDDVRAALADARRAYAEATKLPEPPAEALTVPGEAVDRYRAGAAALARGAVNDAIKTLERVVADYPRYGDARAKLVEAYLFQGLDFYSKGSLSAALRVWRRGLAYDPGNDKIKRYIAKAEAEINQIR